MVWPYFYLNNRLDFDRLVLAPPSVNEGIDIGACATDNMVINPGTTTTVIFPLVPPNLCGTLTGSHSEFPGLDISGLRCYSYAAK